MNQKERARIRSELQAVVDEVPVPKRIPFADGQIEIDGIRRDFTGGEFIVNNGITPCPRCGVRPSVEPAAARVNSNELTIRHACPEARINYSVGGVSEVQCVEKWESLCRHMMVGKK